MPNPANKSASGYTRQQRDKAVATASPLLSSLKTRSSTPLSLLYTPKYNVTKFINKIIQPIKKIATATVVAGQSGVNALLDGYGTNARFANMTCVAYYNGKVYIVDRGNFIIRSYDIITTEVKTFAGSVYGDTNGTTLLNSKFTNPNSITFDSINNIMYLGTTPSIKRIDLNATSNPITTLVNKPAYISNFPCIVYKDGYIYGCDESSSIVFKVNVSTQVFTVIAGTAGSGTGNVDGIGANARFNMSGLPTQNIMVIDNSGNLYLADNNNNSIRKININTTEVTTIKTLTPPGGPYSLSYSSVDNSLYFTQSGKSSIFKLNLNTLVIETVITNNSIGTYSGISNIVDNNLIYVGNGNNRILVKVDF